MASPLDGERRKRNSASEALEARCSGPHETRRHERAPREDTPPAPCSVLCGPRSCSTLPASIHGNGDDSPPEPKRRRLWGLRGLVKMFRRRVKRKSTDPSESPQAPAPTLRARSASELTVDQANRSSGGPYNQGLSVSHDSVFSPDSPPEPTHTAPPALSLATRGVNMVELKAALRRRRGGDSGSGDDDPGLPLSPQTSPTTLDVLNHGLKSYSRTTHSTCSDGSLLSMGSSENDEDSFGAGSLHSSKASLLDGRCQVVDHEPAAGSVPLSHKAARHKIAVKPRRTHGVPRSRRQPQALSSSLPTTPEVNEDFSAKVVESSQSHQEAHWNRQSVPHASPNKVDRIESPPLQESRYEGEITPDPIRIASPDRLSYVDHLPLQKRETPSRVVRKHSRGAYDASPRESDKPPLRYVEEHASRYRRETPLRKEVATGKSGRQKSDPSHLPERGGDVELRRNQIKTKNQNGGQRSSSVEGRLEGHEVSQCVRQSIQDVTQQGGPIIKSSRESLNDGVRGASVHYPELPYSGGEYSTDYPGTEAVSLNRAISSYESAHTEVTITKRESTESFSSEGIPGERSSTDSLTTTPLPGIYIRSSNHTKSSHSIDQLSSEDQIRSRPDSKSFKERTQPENESGGPRSLDSSLTLVHQEESLKKTSSVDYVSSEYKSHMEKSPEVLPSSKGVLRSGSLASSSPATPGTRSRNNSLGDELEKEDLNKVSLRPIKREPSLKKTESESSSVPEFMRIQLNKVQNKGNSVIFNTEQHSQIKDEALKATQGLPASKHETKIITDKQEGRVKANSPSLNKEEIERQKSPIDVFIEEKPRDVDESKTFGASSPQEKIKEEAFYTSTVVATSHRYSPVMKVSPKEESPKDDSLKRKEEKKPAEEIVLRRPSVMDRSAVLDQTITGHSSPTPKEEPELFKVFARRSFKIKDGEPEDTTVPTSDPDSDTIKTKEIKYPQVSSESKVKNTPSNIIAHKENLPPSFATPKSSQPKRYSLGSAPIPFTPPTKVSEPKSTVIVLSGNEANALQDSKKEIPIEASLIDTEFKVKKQPGVPGFKSQSFTQYTVYKSKSRQEPAAKEPLDPSAKPSTEVTSIVKSENKLSSAEKSQKNFNKFADSLMGPLTPSISAGNEAKDKEKSSHIDSSVAMRDPKRSFSNIRKKEESSDEIKNTSAGTFIRPPLARATSLPWQSKEAQMEELVVSNLPPSDNSHSVTTSSFPQSKILDSFVSSQNDSNTLKSASSTDSLSSREAPLSDKEEASASQDAQSLVTSKNASHIAEAKNSTISSFAHSMSSLTGSSKEEPSFKEAIPLNDSDDQCQRQHSFGRTSLGGGIPEDWRVLVRQRREDRLKQTKTGDTEEIIMEQSRPASSRTSKVLEMASNFQKLQVA